MTEERAAALRILSDQLGGGFLNLEPLDNAFVHRSFVNENPLTAARDNERLEFLGDAVLELCISDMLMRAFPDGTEGQLSKLRSALVNEQPLAEMARRYRLGDYLLLGKGEEQSGGRDKSSLLANVLEAVIAATYLERGFDNALTLVSRLFSPLLAQGEREMLYRDYKTAFQEQARSRYGEMPQYTPVGEHGPDHDKMFEVRLTIDGVLDVYGSGKNKKEAEQQAARKALEVLRGSAALPDADVPGRG